ncbi:MAG: tetratricopeptide repeat protein [Sphingomonadaceae bacterium]|nr:tetratricopeptide repeat protein [Sphingomonadaceae bacterium]
MRFSPAAIALSLTLAMISSASIGSRADDDIDTQSIALLKSGNEAARAGDFDSAINWYETALAVDPRNRAAYIAMAEAVKAQGLNGKAIRFYREALEIEPNDQLALAGQTEAMIAKGAIEPARKNIARLKMLCRGDCDVVDRLALSANRAGEKQQLQASALEIKPTVGVAPDAQPN